MIKNIIILLVVILCNIQSVTAQTKVEKKVTSDSLKNYVQNIIKAHNMVGVQVAVVSSTETINLGAFGRKKLDGDSLEISDKMHLGSCGKAMTGYLAGILVEKKILRWDSTLEEIFPELVQTMNKKFRKVTLSDLLSHQSKLPQFFTDEEWKILSRFTEKNPQKRRYNFTKWVLSQKPIPFKKENRKAGFRYSNAGYGVAAAMIEKATNKEWEKLMQEEVFLPLQMNVTFGWAAREDIQQPWGHIFDKEKNILIAHNPNSEYQVDSILSPAGNMSMSVVDYSKFIQKNLLGLNGLDKEYNKEFYDYLHYVNIKKSEYSIGWYSIHQSDKNNPFDDMVSTHSGSADTFFCINFLLPKHNIAILLIANSANEETQIGLKKIRNYLLRNYVEMK
ncbi:serine hydrolase domain-containing protein [Bernardetia sp. OM2101]|uniref:serine hydrolase domain-containing protein n=1 Tax=Bernardetia sp. OM2101 TaxID=3344876 RepID=UPI0035D0ED9F